MVITMLIASGNPKTFWTEAVSTTCYIITRCVIGPIIYKNPYELLKGGKPT